MKLHSRISLITNSSTTIYWVKKPVIPWVDAIISINYRLSKEFRIIRRVVFSMTTNVKLKYETCDSIPLLTKLAVDVIGHLDIESFIRSCMPCSEEDFFAINDPDFLCFENQRPISVTLAKELLEYSLALTTYPLIKNGEHWEYYSTTLFDGFVTEIAQLAPVVYHMRDI